LICPHDKFRLSFKWTSRMFSSSVNLDLVFWSRGVDLGVPTWSAMRGGPVAIPRAIDLVVVRLGLTELAGEGT